MTSSAAWGRLTIYLDAARQWRRRSLVTEIVLRALEGKLRGASVRCGIAGFGDAGTVRRKSVLPVVQHLPAEIVLVDDLVVLQAFVTRLDRMQGVLLATLQPVEVVDNPAGAGRDRQAW
jgi:PII-like signaling protein